MSKNIFKIVITGGPCAGKTTGMSRVTEELTQRGYRVFVVPEAATELLGAGFTIGDTGLPNMAFQKAILKTQIQREQLYEHMVRLLPDENIVLLCDRGALDGKAYCPNEEFAYILSEMGVNETTLRDEYDAVMHLRTAADGAGEFYTLENNKTRSESPELAIIRDRKTAAAWTGHPHFRVIDNSTDFPRKINRLVAEVLKFLGEPVPLEIERKYLIKMPDLKKLTEYQAEKIDILQTYLKTEIPGEERRIRQRGVNGNYVYYLTTKRALSSLTRVETEKRINFREYATLLMQADTDLKQIRKERYCFIYNNLYFELDVYPFWNDKAILEIEMTEENQDIIIPGFIDVIRDVTEDLSYKNYSIAKQIPT